MVLSKYVQVARISWDNGFVYRLNFLMWRVRMVLQLLTVFFVWKAVLTSTTNPFGYSGEQMLTYIVGTSLLRSLVFSSRSIDAQGEISSGDLNNYLVKPLGYFAYWFSRDTADKLLNLLFSIGEIGLLFLLLRPPLVPAASSEYLLLSVVSGAVAMMLYFFFSFIISMSTFWMPESNGWPQRFFVFVLLEFFAGGLFPLDILPSRLAAVVSAMPTAYFLHAPLQIYLGRMTLPEAWQAIGVAGMWMVAFYGLAVFMFRRGVRVYGAYGR